MRKKRWFCASAGHVRLCWRHQPSINPASSEVQCARDFGFCHHLAVLDDVGARGLKANGLGGGGRVQHHGIGHGARLEAVVAQAEDLGRVGRGHGEHLLDLVGHAQVRSVGGQQGDFQRVVAAKGVEGVAHAVLAKADVDAAIKQLAHARDATALGLRVQPALQHQVGGRVGDHVHPRVGYLGHDELGVLVRVARQRAGVACGHALVPAVFDGLGRPGLLGCCGSGRQVHPTCMSMSASKRLANLEGDFDDGVRSCAGESSLKRHAVPTRPRRGPWLSHISCFVASLRKMPSCGRRRSGCRSGGGPCRHEAARDVARSQWLAVDAAPAQKDADRFDEDHQHGRRHGGNRPGVELGPAKLKRHDQSAPARIAQPRKADLTQRNGNRKTQQDAEQHRQIADEAPAELDDGQHEHQQQRRHAQVQRLAKIGIALAAARPVDAHAHQRDADHQNDNARHHGRKQRHQAANERRYQKSDQARGDGRAKDAQQPQLRVGAYGQHGADRNEGHAHDDGQANANAPHAHALQDGDQAAGEQISGNQQRDLLLGQLQRRADDQRNRDGAGIHDQHMLQAQRKHLGQWQNLIDSGNLIACFDGGIRHCLVSLSGLVQSSDSQRCMSFNTARRRACCEHSVFAVFWPVFVSA
ncbi:hypothetical protein FQA39_LY18616 [Lamprigera yunnana]|nr:hypothetical protein FQA39_LY18616 [Lamprigera yunnana]